MSLFFQLLSNNGISPLVPPHSTTLTALNTTTSSQTSLINNEEGNKENRHQQKIINTWTRRKCIWRWRRRVGICTKVEACFRLISCFCFTLLLIIAFLYSIGWSWTIADLNFADISSSHSKIRILQVENICSSSSINKDEEACCTVVDILDYTRRTAHRAFYFGVFNDVPSNDFESEVALIPPKALSNVFNSDTRLWNIDHFSILNEYVAAMVIIPFVVESLQNHQNEKNLTSSNNVLIIGLGGGSLDMFLHKKFPWLNISIFELNSCVVKLAEKWFDTVNDETRHVYVQDGLEAFSKGKIRGREGKEKSIQDSQLLYDAIIIDACNSIKNNQTTIKQTFDHHQQQQQMPCPSTNLISSKSLGLIKRSLSSKGVAIFNLLPLINEELNVQKFIQRRLAAHFPTCMRYKMAKQANNILACLTYSITENQKSSKNEMFKFWKFRLTKLINEFGFKGLLNDSTLIF